MNPQEKAKWLIEKMIENSCTPHPDDYSGDLWEVHIEKAKQCAIMVCNEVLDQFPEMKIQKNCNYEWDMSPHPTHDFWSSVKRSIELYDYKLSLATTAK